MIIPIFTRLIISSTTNEEYCIDIDDWFLESEHGNSIKQILWKTCEAWIGWETIVLQYLYPKLRNIVDPEALHPRRQYHFQEHQILTLKVHHFRRLCHLRLPHFVKVHKRRFLQLFNLHRPKLSDLGAAEKPVHVQESYIGQRTINTVMLHLVNLSRIFLLWGITACSTKLIRSWHIFPMLRCIPFQNMGLGYVAQSILHYIHVENLMYGRSRRATSHWRAVVFKWMQQNISNKKKEIIYCFYIRMQLRWRNNSLN